MPIFVKPSKQTLNSPMAAALQSLLISNVPFLDEVRAPPLKPSKFQLIGHRGNGMNLQSSNSNLSTVKENSILSFNQAGRFPISLVEFDVQVTCDDHAVIFHDISILTDGDNDLSEHRITNLSLEEFLSYGPQKAPGNLGKPLLRRGADGRVSRWAVDADKDDCLCTLREAFERVSPHLGFNIELKFDDDFNYREEELAHSLSIIWSVVSDHAGDRHVVFSSFHPDAARIIRGMQSSYPVLFLTEAGVELYRDQRRNTMEAAIELCSASRLQGIVSDVRCVFHDPSVIGRIKEAGLKLYTYGEMNNVVDAVYAQHLMGVDGVIVDLVREITEAVVEQIGGERRRDESFEEWFGAVEGGEITLLSQLRPQLVQEV